MIQFLIGIHWNGEYNFVYFFVNILNQLFNLSLAQVMYAM